MSCTVVFTASLRVRIAAPDVFPTGTPAGARSFAGRKFLKVLRLCVIVCSAALVVRSDSCD